MAGLERVEPTRRNVVVAFPLGDEATAHLSSVLGPAFDVRDIRVAPRHVDVLLCPPVSPQAIQHLKRMYPSAAIVAIELDDLLRDAHVRGPVSRVLDAGADAYFVASSLDSLGAFLQQVVDSGSDAGANAHAIAATSTLANTAANPPTGAALPVADHDPATVLPTMPEPAAARRRDDTGEEHVRPADPTG